MTTTPGTNVEQVAYWDGERGQSWVAEADRYDAQLEIYALHAVAAAAPQPGDHVIDIGCGAGATSFEAARAVGPQGRVVGIDISRPMLELANRRAQAMNQSNVEFVLGDAQTMDPLEHPAKAVVSRFGVMFFDDPVAAFRNIATMTAPEGRLAFACWGAVESNEWLAGPAMAVADLVALPEPLASDAPGPFAFADSERVESILTEAGWENISFEEVHDSIYVGGPGSVEQAVDFVLAGTGVGLGVAALDADRQADARQRIAGIFEAQHDGIGVRYPAFAHLVHAVRGD